MRNFEQLMAAARKLAGRDDAAAALRRLRDAALADEHGKALDTAHGRHRRLREEFPMDRYQARPRT